IRSIMHGAGWSGPKPMRFINATGKDYTTKGYYRAVDRSIALPDVVQEPHAPGDLEDSRGLPAVLERVTLRGLHTLDRVLKAPFDASDGVLTRNKVTAAGIAINAQLKADEHRLRTKQTGDALQRLLKIIEKEKKLLEVARAVQQND